MKILNLYACLGGNRYKWEGHDVTAIELDPEAARLYQERFPGDLVIVADAHQYLLDHYKEFDFIWSSPPCPTHSKVRHSQKNKDFFIPKYPEMGLYQEVLFLKHHFKGLYCIENVIPYYEPLIPAQKRGRHLYWCNFLLPEILSNRKVRVSGGLDEVKKLSTFHDFDFSLYKGTQRTDKMARNLVDYEAGKTILDAAMGVTPVNTKQQTLI